MTYLIHLYKRITNITFPLGSISRVTRFFIYIWEGRIHLSIKVEIDDWCAFVPDGNGSVKLEVFKKKSEIPPNAYRVSKCLLCKG